MRLDRHITHLAPRRIVALAAAFLLVSAPTAGAVQSAAPLTALSSVFLIDASRQGGTLIVSGDVASRARLPLVIEIPIPAGAAPSWVGEISGGDPSTDPAATYSIRHASGYDITTLTLKKYRRGQVEIALPNTGVANPGQNTAGTPYAIGLPILGPVASASLEFDVPAGSIVSSQSAGLVKEVSSSSSDRYSMTRSSPSVGSVVRASLIVALPPTGSPQQPVQGAPSSSQGSTRPLGSPIEWMLLLASVVFFAYNAQRFAQSRAARKAAEAAAAGASTSAVGQRMDAGASHDSKHKAKPRGQLSESKSGQDASSRDRELKRLQDRRARGEMTRREFLLAKSELFGGKQGTHVTR